VKSKLLYAAVHLSALLIALSGTAYASGSSGGGGGGGTVPNLSGNWSGQYQFTGAGVTRARLVIVEDGAGNFIYPSRLCYGAAANSCSYFSPGSMVQSNGALEFGAARILFQGAITGTTACLDGSSGTVISGTIKYSERGGTFSFNTCPV
jgi:hypothetical protein